jgi:hypothetical protein
MSAMSAPLWPLAGARIAIGLLWLISLRWKLPPAFLPGEGRGLLDWMELQIAHALLPFYGQLVEQVVIPNFTTFAWLIFLIELMIGLSLGAGLFSRAGALLGLLWSINLAIGFLGVPGEWPWSYVMLVMWHAVFLISAPGRVLGLDTWLRARPASAWLMRWT